MLWYLTVLFNFIYLFIYLWLCWVFISVQGLSLVAASGDHSSSRCAGLSLSRPFLLRSTGSRCEGSALWLTGLVAPWHVGSSQTRARTRVPCIGRQTLNHCATREAHCSFFKLKKNFFNWSIVNLQCFSFWCTAKWFNYTFFFIFFFIPVYYKTLNIIPCAIQWDLLVHLFCI